MSLSEILNAPQPPALLIGNGINRFRKTRDEPSWERLLGKLAADEKRGLGPDQVGGMSNTEFFDILELGKKPEDIGQLQKKFCGMLETWKPAQHHERIVRWAQRRNAPVITLNFDHNLSNAIGADYFSQREGFTYYYPWTSYFSDKRIASAKDDFAIWHAHGMVRHPRSIRLGLTHYMGAVQRARAMIYGKEGGLWHRAKNRKSMREWSGRDSWLHPFFFSPLLILGAGLGRDEVFIRWLLLERERFFARADASVRKKTWYVGAARDGGSGKAFLDALGVKAVRVSDYRQIYDNPSWSR